MALSIAAKIVAEDNLFDFFKDRVESASRAQRRPVTQDTVYYLSHLLAEAGHAEEAGAGAPSTLVEMRERAANGGFAESVTWWKRMGDHALLGVGFFRENLRQRRLSIDYYAEMGAGAYGTLARILREPSSNLPDVFGELSTRFETCAEVINEVREESRENNATDIVRLYEEWLASGSPRVAERLRQLGMLPVRFAGNG
ncbi:MAG: hypothetical protein FJ102_03160 [Deltaproteobacteria bacterium]|nr:hypothetical protein [Deltaproteobacteria bacterium]